MSGRFSAETGNIGASGHRQLERERERQERRADARAQNGVRHPGSLDAGERPQMMRDQSHSGDAGQSKRRGDRQPLTDDRRRHDESNGVEGGLRKAQ